jgi:hypothetical protein
VPPLKISFPQLYTESTTVKRGTKLPINALLQVRQRTLHSSSASREARFDKALRLTRH